MVGGQALTMVSAGTARHCIAGCLAAFEEEADGKVMDLGERGKGHNRVTVGVESDLVKPCTQVDCCFMSVPPSVCLPFLSFCVCLSLCICLSVCLFLCLCLPVYTSLSLLCLSVCLCLSVAVSVHLSAPTFSLYLLLYVCWTQECGCL